MKRKINYKKWLLINILCIFILLFALNIIGIGIVHQETNSMEKGWYLTLPLNKIKRGEIVIFQPRNTIYNYMIRHGWLRARMSMMKHVLAMPGDKVCTLNHQLRINGHWIGKIYIYYTKHFLLPQWHFCGRLLADEYLLVSTFSKHSFDSRYFGPIRRKQIYSKGIKL